MNPLAERANRLKWGPGNREFDLVEQSMKATIAFGNPTQHPLGNGAPQVMNFPLL